jgi:D-Tyr-tRNAtyr deacylase
MIALIQRVREARVEVAGRVTGAIGQGCFPTTPAR